MKQEETSAETTGRDIAQRKKPQRDASARRVRVGLRHLAGANTHAEALAPEGLAPTTIYNARANGYGKLDTMRAALAVLPETARLGDLKPLATRRLKAILEDESESSSTVAQTALAVHKIAAELDEPDAPPKLTISAATWKAMLRRHTERTWARAYAQGARAGIEAAGSSRAEELLASLTAPATLTGWLDADLRAEIERAARDRRRALREGSIEVEAVESSGPRPPVRDVEGVKQW